MDEMKKGTIDLIIPTYKPDKTFAELLNRIKVQTVSVRHIYIINTEESLFDEERFDLEDNVTVIHITKEMFDHGGTRNYGASLSNAEFVMFMTQDAMPANRYLIENILRGFEQEEVAAVYGRQLPRKDAKVIECYTREFNYPDKDQLKSKRDLETLGIKTYFCSNVCAAYRKSVYEMMNGFVTKTIFNEDMIMAANMIEAGYSIFYASKAVVRHSHEYTYREQFSRNFDLAVSQKEYHDIFGKVKSENEGMRLVKDTMKYLANNKKAYLIPDLIIQSGFKYLGYKAGKNYDKLPMSVIRKLSMNPSYWKVEV